MRNNEQQQTQYPNKLVLKKSWEKEMNIVSEYQTLFFNYVV